MKNLAAVVSLAAVPGMWLQRAPHWSIPFLAFGVALVSSNKTWTRGGLTVFVLYVAVWALSPVDAHRSFQLAVLRAPGMDCAQVNSCADGAIEWSQRVYGEEVGP